jgi:Na+(H+)/acetate symporter ActP
MAPSRPRANAAGVVASTLTAMAGSIYFFIAQQLGFAASHGWWVPPHGFPSVGFVMLLSFIVFIVASLLVSPGHDGARPSDPGR